MEKNVAIAVAQNNASGKPLKRQEAKEKFKDNIGQPIDLTRRRGW